MAFLRPYYKAKRDLQKKSALKGNFLKIIDLKKRE